MKLYLVKAGKSQRYAGSMTEVRALKAELAVSTKTNKKLITVEDVEVKVSKPELLTLLNDLCKRGE